MSPASFVGLLALFATTILVATGPATHGHFEVARSTPARSTNTRITAATSRMQTAGKLFGGFSSAVNRRDIGARVIAAESPATQQAEELMETMLRPQDKAGDGLRKRFAENIRRAQLEICNAIEELDGGAKFHEDAWDREGGGGGRTRVLAKGNVFEKAGVALSVVYGNMPLKAISVATEDPKIIERAKALADETDSLPFFVASISSVMHPRNPFAPTMHFNYRFFDFENSSENGLWWFGGGTDITPSYLVEEDIKHFHQSYKDVCDKHDPEFYSRFKSWADRYFQIKHRGETRGLGGIFFDDMNDRDPEKIFAFSKDCLDNVVSAYVPIVAKHKDDDFTQKNKDWQQMRRGRYVEFNLVYDRGTTFGLRTGGRVESILMSLPETARWEYSHQVEPNSPEAEILEVFKNPRDWV